VDRLLSIGLFARRSRLSLKALRLYERQGLLRPAHVDPCNGYRGYHESQLATARLIAMLRGLDMPLARVAAVVAADDARRAELVAAYWQAVESRLASQRELAAYVRARLMGGDMDLDAYHVRERALPEQLVLSEQRHVRVDELERWLPEAFARLTRTASRLGGPADAPFAIYHGEVSEDGDGPVEVCVPIDPTRPPPLDVATRREPARREAYVRIRKAQVQYPQILAAYEAVAHWIAREGRSQAGAPREVYFARERFEAAEPGDEVCDVAYPIE
jgi:DNA-binding transcriptional MerR regulator